MGVGVGVGVGVGAGAEIFPEQEPEKSKMTGSGNPALLVGRILIQTTEHDINAA